MAQSLSLLNIKMLFTLILKLLKNGKLVVFVSFCQERNTISQRKGPEIDPGLSKNLKFK